MPAASQVERMFYQVTCIPHNHIDTVGIAKPALFCHREPVFASSPPITKEARARFGESARGRKGPPYQPAGNARVKSVDPARKASEADRVRWRPPPCALGRPMKKESLPSSAKARLPAHINGT